jgi:acyl carrier protein
MIRLQAAQPTAPEVLLQPLLAALPARGSAAQDAFLPVSADSVEISAELGDLTEELWSVATLRPAKDTDVDLSADVVVHRNGAAQPVARFLGIRLVRLGTPARTSAAPPPSVPVIVSRRAKDNVQHGTCLIRHAATVLGLPAAQIDHRRTLRDLGLDSLMAARLRSLLRAETGVELPVQRLLGPEAIGALAAAL